MMDVISAADIAALLGNIKGVLLAFKPLVGIVGKVLGLALIGWGLLSAVMDKGRGEAKYAGSIAKIIFGTILLNLSGAIAMSGESITGTALDIGQGYSPSGSAVWVQAVHVAFYTAWIVGLIGFIKGWKDLSHHDPDRRGAAITMIIGGTAAMNLPTLLGAVAELGPGTPFGYLGQLLGL